MGSIRSRNPLPPLTKSLLLTSIMGLSSALCANPLVPDDIAYRPEGKVALSQNTGDAVVVGTAQLPASTTQPPSEAGADTPAQTHYLPQNQCADRSRDHNTLHKSLVITRFTRRNPQSANAGNLYAAEAGIPEMIRAQLTRTHQLLPPAMITQGFALPNLSETQLKQQAQKIARQTRAQFVLSGTIDDMAMTDASSTYNPGLYRQLANGFHNLTGIEKFDKRTRLFTLELELRDGFTGEPLLNRRYSASGVWNTRKAIGFDSPAFLKTPYGRNVAKLSGVISDDIAQTVDCQPYIASIDAHPGQTQVILQGGANNGLQAGAKMQLYQVIVVGSNSEYQVSETRLVRRPTQLHLSEVYPSHSTAVVEDGSYLNGHYLAVID
ncbi:hypothetical protein O59_003820 [Cellvibrio sp. BR]|uniref:flagella assembly protein FlgT middle domain-containing protein n=1 Tax=Cellvibrio sp. BR TaxID=1134474 RepID=UPI00026018D0|nr:flagella assembly protein FlgT middle domain-containing protein [Cellvibrio sp. BR]EIK43422.1 hypothetical protein O59_003820 [Cellvibrio sp. BR]